VTSRTLATRLVPRVGASVGSRDPGTRSLVRNSLSLVVTTLVTSGLGYASWILVARFLDPATVGLASAVISFSTVVSLATHLGVGPLLIRRLPAVEGRPEWLASLVSALLVSSGLTGLAGLGLGILAVRCGWFAGVFEHTLGFTLSVVGAVVWTALNVVQYAFTAVRRSELTLVANLAVSGSKCLLLVPLLLVVEGPVSVLLAWTLSATVGLVVALVRLLPRTGMPLRRDLLRFRCSVGALREGTGHHLTSLGGSLVPWLLPPLVAVRLGAEANGFFYLTWMVGSILFAAAPAVSSALLAEGAREGSDLHGKLRTSGALVAILIVPPGVLLFVGSEWVLRLFGPEYPGVGSTLLRILAVAAIPDAVTSLIVGVFRVKGWVWRSTVLNVGMAVTAVGLAWTLGPRHGIEGVGLAWLVAQTLGAVLFMPSLVKAVSRGLHHPAHRLC